MMKKHKTLWEDYERNWMRFVMTYRLGDSGKTSRKVMFKKAKFLDGYMVCKPFRKE